MKNLDDYAKLVEIAKRAEKMNLMAFNRTSLLMDLDCVHETFNLRLDDLLNADDYNFAHDIVGIQNNLNRQTMKMENLFLPRYASQ